MTVNFLELKINSRELMLVSADSLRIYGAKPALTFDDSLYRLT
ncbi:hypothetical protein [Ligilactobacillus salivarius]|nr:hypothetical protein [Ligilactobacillus salivarius]